MSRSVCESRGDFAKFALEPLEEGGERKLPEASSWERMEGGSLSRDES